MGAFAAMSLRSTSAFEDSDIPRNQLLSIFPLYTPFHNEAQLTIKGSAHQEIAGVSAEGYEGLRDGQKHGFTIHGLNVENDTVLDTVRITVSDAQGNPVTGLEDISLDALAGVTVGADGAVYVPLLSEMGAYQIEYTVERGLLFKPFAATASLNLLKGTTVIGVDTSVLYDGKEHTIGLDNLDGAQVVSWWTSVDGHANRCAAHLHRGRRVHHLLCSAARIDWRTGLVPGNLSWQRRAGNSSLRGCGQRLDGRIRRRKPWRHIK